MTSYRALYYKAFAMRDTDPQASVEQMILASRQAKDAGDARGALYIDHWILQTLLNRLGDYTRSYDLAVQAVLEARKPVHAGQMERICVHEDLIDAYEGVDPLGNASVIQDAFNFMAQEVTPDLDCRHCLLGAQIDFELTCGKIDQALTDTQRYLSETEGSAHYQGLAHLSMAKIMRAREDWEKMLQHANRAAQYLSQIESNARSEASALAGRTLALRRLGFKPDAQVAYKLATGKAEAIAGVLPRSYYDFLCDFWQVEWDMEAALALRDKQLAELIGKGQIYWEAVCRLQRVKLLKQLKRPFAEEAEPIRALAAKLRDPQVILKPLEELAG